MTRCYALDTFCFVVCVLILSVLLIQTAGAEESEGEGSYGPSEAGRMESEPY